VETADGRFLLVDPTSRFTPLGRLPSAHAGRRVLVCTERGGIWVAVPEAAVFPERVKFRMAGALEAGGGFTGTLEIHEEAGALGLREADVEGGAEALRRRCLRLGLPPDAQCTVARRSDPFDLERPYEVVFEARYAGALRSLGQGEWLVEPPGLRADVAAIQKPGRPRLQPLRFDRRDGLEYELALRLPRPMAPVLGSEKGETALRSYAWTSEVSLSPSPELKARLVEERRPARFGFDQREEGLAAWRKDRATVRRLREDGLAFKDRP
jgi:hypothetical protein